MKVILGDEVKIVEFKIKPQGERQMKINILANGMTWTAADGTDSKIKRVLVESVNGAKGRLIWEHPNDKPRFLGDNMTQSQLDAGKRAAMIAETAKLNKSASSEDIHTLLTEGGWDSIYPMA